MLDTSSIFNLPFKEKRKMALAADGYTLVIQFADTGGNITTRSHDLTSADDAAATTDAAAILAAYANVTDAAVKGYSINKKFVEQSLSLPAAAEVENNLQLTLKIFQKPNKSGTLRIPAPKAGLFVSTSGQGYNQPDFTDAALTTFINLFTTGGEATISDGEVAVLADAKGKRVHAKSSRG